ncbi:MAG: hypothetical protein KatS3mg129_0027 [Leptospiraceae bacterium]|nr:MAG: hypothetical protein KatS3mg129_0027 [Leptospiraceae bacterium]
MQRIIYILMLGNIIFYINCKESEKEVYAKYPARVIQVENQNIKGTTYIVQAEKLYQLDIKEEDKKLLDDIKKNLGVKNASDIIKVKLTDGTIGFTRKNAIGGKPFVVIAEEINVYLRPGGDVYHKIPIGSLCNELEENKEYNMIKISCYDALSGGPIQGKWISGKWIKKEENTISYNREDIEDVKLIQKAIMTIKKAKNPDNKNVIEALETLNKIIEKNSSTKSYAAKKLEEAHEILDKKIVEEETQEVETQELPEEQPQEETQPYNNQ